MKGKMMGCYWSFESFCSMDICVLEENKDAFEQAVKKYGLLDNFTDFGWTMFGDGQLEYCGDSFVDGYAPYGFDEVIANEIMVITEPGSYVDMYSDGDTCLVSRAHPRKVEYGFLKAVFH